MLPESLLLRIRLFHHLSNRIIIILKLPPYRTRLNWSAPGWGKGSKRATGTHPREGGNRVRLVYQADGQTAERGRGGSGEQRIPALLSGDAEWAEDRVLFSED